MANKPRTVMTIKQDAFVKAYLLNGGNATQAAITAGYSKNTAQEIGSENLLKPLIAAAIAKHQKKSNDSFIFSKDKKLKLLQKVMMKCALEHDDRGMLNAQSVIAAIKEHNIMQGDNAPTEQVTYDEQISSVKIEVVSASKD